MLAWQLMQRGQSTVIVNHEKLPSASRVAAGLFNPVTGQRFVLQAHAETLIPAARNFYKQLENQFGQTLFFDKVMLRIIKNEKELAAISRRKSDPAYSTFLGEITASTDINAPYGVIEQLQTGYLDTNALLNCLREYFIEQHAYLNKHFHYSDLERTESGICWQGLSARRVIFCEGYMGKENPWFNCLPFQPAKGDILTLQSNAKLPGQVINGGRWLLPLQNGHYKTGATYDHDLSITHPTEHAKESLIKGMLELFTKSFGFEIVEQQCGVRPNTLDKNPFIGFHPEHKQLGIFNGFGSKGSILIPWYANNFAGHVAEGSDIPARADIARIQ